MTRFTIVLVLIHYSVFELSSSWIKFNEFDDDEELSLDLIANPNPFYATTLIAFFKTAKAALIAFSASTATAPSPVSSTVLAALTRLSMINRAVSALISSQTSWASTLKMVWASFLISASTFGLSPHPARYSISLSHSTTTPLSTNVTRF